MEIAIIKPRAIFCSGYFNPPHKGHIDYLKEAARYGELHVIINNDDQVKLKGAIPLLNVWHRYNIISNLKFVTKAYISIDTDLSVNKTLEHYAGKDVLIGYEIFFANGGDVTDSCREEKVCSELDIKLVYGIGGNKIQSSSNLIKKAIEHYNANLRVQGST